MFARHVDVRPDRAAALCHRSFLQHPRARVRRDASALRAKEKGPTPSRRRPSVSGLPPKGGSCPRANSPAPPVRVRFYCVPYALFSPGNAGARRVSGQRPQTTRSVPWWFESSRQRVPFRGSHQRGASRPTAVRPSGVADKCHFKKGKPFWVNATHSSKIQPRLCRAKSRTESEEDFFVELQNLKVSSA